MGAGFKPAQSPTIVALRRGRVRDPPPRQTGATPSERLAAGMRPQVVVPAGVWQGSRLTSGGRYALLGTTVAPGFAFEDYEHGSRDALAATYPGFADRVRALTRE